MCDAVAVHQHLPKDPGERFNRSTFAQFRNLVHREQGVAIRFVIPSISLLYSFLRNGEGESKSPQLHTFKMTVKFGLN